MPPYRCTAPAPALYAARASGVELNCLSRPDSIRAAPSTAWDGSSGFTPRPAAVLGISCIRPWAPAGLTARALYPDSTFATAASSFGETPYFAPAWLNRLPYGTEASPLATLRPAGRRVSTAEAAPPGSTRRIAVGVVYTLSILTWSPVCGAAIIWPLPT